MAIFTKKQLVKHLNQHFQDKDNLYVLWWSKDQFEGKLDRKIKEIDWEFAIENLNTESEEQLIDETIEETLMSEMGEQETA
jgi:hypothetical protein